MTADRSFALHGVSLPLSGQALDLIAAGLPMLAPGEDRVAACRTELAALLAADFPGGYSDAAFRVAPRERRALLMTAVHRAALAGLERYP